GIRDFHVTGVQTCALPISRDEAREAARHVRAAKPHAAYLAATAPPVPRGPPAARSADRDGISRTACARQAAGPPSEALAIRSSRSEERRVGKESRCGW